MKPRNEHLKETYMYITAREEIETKRLQILNELHNANTLNFITPYVPGRKRILEIGLGSGQLAYELLLKADAMTEYTGIDKDPAQIEHSKKALATYKDRIKLIQMDLINSLNELEKLGKFDLIYCRWLLVHLPKTEIISILKVLVNLLTINGVFICDECDNRDVTFRPNNIIQPTTPYQKANQLWAEISQALMVNLKNDLELTSNKIMQFLTEASNGQGLIKFEGQYQVTLRNEIEKNVIPDGYRSSHAILSQALQMPVEPIIELFDACAHDAGIDIDFLTQNVVSFCRI